MRLWPKIVVDAALEYDQARDLRDACRFVAQSVTGTHAGNKPGGVEAGKALQERCREMDQQLSAVLDSLPGDRTC